MDEAQFTAYFQRAWPRLVAYARRSLDLDAACDVAAETLRTLWSKQVPCPAAGDDARLRQLDGLAFRIAAGLVSNEWRARRRRRALAARLAAGGSPGTPAGDPAQEAVGSPASLLGGLPAPEREVVALLVAGYRVHEIAGLLGISPGAASMRLARARAHLRAQMEDGEDGA